VKSHASFSNNQKFRPGANHPSLLAKKWLLIATKDVKKGEGGYLLQISVILSVALIIGVAAFASRSTSGLFGFAELGVNKESREVAENAIQEMIGSLNKEENRRLLIAGNAKTWSATDGDLKNPCTQYSTLSSSTPGAGLNANAADILRFKVSGGRQLSNDGDPNHQFEIQSVEYKKSDRTGFNNGVSATGADYVSTRDGVTRSLIRITVVGYSTRNGITSSARVAREFEVVPKCCKRSFGNSSGGEFWGRDLGVCSITTSTSGSSRGILGALNGGSISGNGSFEILDELNKEVSSAICYYNDGSVSSSGDLSTSVTTDNCEDSPVLGTNDGVTFNPEPLQFTSPKYNNPECPPGSTTTFCKNNPSDNLSLNGEKHKYLYFDTFDKQVKLCDAGVTNQRKLNGGISGCVSIGSLIQTGTPQQCYVDNVSNTGADAKTDLRPYYQVSCSLRVISLANNSSLTIDTTAAKFNLHFNSWNGNTGYLVNDSNLPDSEQLSYIGAAGQTTFQRVQCRSGSVGLADDPNLAKYQSTGTACTKPLVWTTTTPLVQTSFQDQCKATFNGVPLTRCESFDNSELLNIYSMGYGSFEFAGESGGLGFNLIAPYASVKLVGGGSPAGVDFMGRIWTNKLSIQGNPEIRTFSSLPGFCLQSGACNVNSQDPIFDYVARSYSQSQGF
jgi:hypothetical protein